MPVVIAIGYLLSMPLLSLLFSSTISEGLSATWSFVVHAALLFSLGVLLNIPGPALKVLLLNVNRPHCRGTATAVGELFNNVGRVVGPVVFTCLLRSDDRVASTLSISNFFYVSATLSFLLRYTVEEDEDAVREYINNVKISPMERDEELDKKNEIVPLLQFCLCSSEASANKHTTCPEVHHYHPYPEAPLPASREADSQHSLHSSPTHNQDTPAARPQDAHP